jgi:hypothetical protein
MESVKERIWLMIEELQSHPPPNLPLEGGGGVEKVFPESRRSKVSAYAPKGRGETTFDNTDGKLRRVYGKDRKGNWRRASEAKSI